mgnify:CR=1 FL=1
MANDNPLISQVQITVDVEGTPTLTTFDIKDAYARSMIDALGNSIYWIGVTSTELVDNTTASAVITVNNESVTANIGGMAQYNGEEFVWNGQTWQSVGKNNFGALAFKASASADYTPVGSVTVTPSKDADTTTSITPFGSAGTLPSMSVTGEVLTFNAGTLPSGGTAVDVVTASGSVTATAAFVGTQSTITVQ